jgi:hypothetical protein
MMVLSLVNYSITLNDVGILEKDVHLPLLEVLHLHIAK